MLPYAQYNLTTTLNFQTAWGQHSLWARRCLFLSLRDLVWDDLMFFNLFVASDGLRSSNLLATSFQALSFSFLSLNSWLYLLWRQSYSLYLHFFPEVPIRKLKFLVILFFLINCIVVAESLEQKRFYLSDPGCCGHWSRLEVFRVVSAECFYKIVWVFLVFWVFLNFFITTQNTAATTKWKPGFIQVEKQSRNSNSNDFKSPIISSLRPNKVWDWVQRLNFPYIE